jgi:predicted outer membrane protein
MIRLISTAILAYPLALGVELEGSRRHLDDEFLIWATAEFRAESRCAELAADRATRYDVKTFANSLRGRCEQTETRLAAELGKKPTISVGPEMRTRERLEALRDLHGTTFELIYLKQAIASHESAVAMCEAQINYGKDQTVSEIARDLLPGLRERLSQARELAR